LPHHRHHPRPRETIDSCVESGNWTIIDPPKWHRPHPFEKFEEFQRTELTLPGDTGDIFLHSRGIHAVGVLDVVEVADREDIGIDVIVGRNKDSDLLQRSSFCTLSRGENGHGLGIFVSSQQTRLLTCVCSCTG
jgi:hypothetical protein